MPDDQLRPADPDELRLSLSLALRLMGANATVRPTS
jgi:hypothetical protein